MYFSVVKDKPPKCGIRSARQLVRKTWVSEDVCGIDITHLHTRLDALARAWSDVPCMFSGACTCDRILNLLLAATSETTGQGQREEQEEETEGETKQEEETSKEEEEET